MARTRPYSRKELESLRRADLQNLYKIHGLKGANQKSDALIDSLEEYFVSAAYKALPPGSPNKSLRSAIPLPVSTHPAAARQLKPIPSQGAPRVVLPGRPVTRKSPSKAEVVRERPGKVVSAIPDGISAAAKKDRPLPSRPPITHPSQNDSLARRVALLSDKVQEIESDLIVSPLATLTGEIASLRSEVSRLDADIAALRSQPHAGGSTEDQAWESRMKEAEERWAARLNVAEAVWTERFRVLESKIGASSGSASDAVREEGVPSATALGKRRQREDLGAIGFPSEDTTSPAKRRRNDDNPSPSRDHLMALARRSASPTKSPRTPSPGRSSSQGVFKTPDLPASAMKQIQSQPKTPPPAQQGLLPDQSATPGFTSDYFAGLPPTTNPSGRRGSSEVNLPFPLFATTPRPVAPTSPTTDAPPSTARRARADVSALGNQLLTPGRRPTRTVSQAHLELSTVIEDLPSPSGGIPTPPRRDSSEPTSLPSLPGDNPHHLPFFGPELGSNGEHPPRLSPSPSITGSRFSSLPFPSKPNSKLGRTATPSSLPLNSHSAVPDRMSGVGADTTPPSAGPTLSMMTPGHRTMLGTESYRDTRFGDLPVTMSWGTPEMPDTPRPGSIFGSGT